MKENYALMTCPSVKPGGGRDCSIDILKGFGIILVLVAHSLGGYVHTFAYSFHMPLFFLVTGYFCKPKPKAEAMKKDFSRLFVPFFFTAIVMLIISMALSPFDIDGVKSPAYTFEALIYGNGSSVNHHKIWGNWSVVGSVWFLPALFWAKTVFNCLIHKENNITPWVILMIGGLAAWAGQYILLPYSLLQGLTALPFLLIGYYAKKAGGLDVVNKMIVSKVSLAVLVVSCCVGWFMTTFGNNLDMAQFNWSLCYYPNLLFATAGTYVFYLISLLISKMNGWISSSLAFLGKYSLILVCFPVIETYVIPFNQMIPNMPMKSFLLLACKVLWCVLAMVVSFKIPILRKLFAIK